MQESYGRMEREKHRREDNRRFILQAAENVFARLGFVQATMDIIASESQFSKATIYKYFKNKPDLFFTLFCNPLMKPESPFSPFWRNR